ncbi:TPA: phosphatidylserine decarboxylase [Methanosarcina acetivorans]|uniref:Putative archaetidylserine decarboxylase proenzyme n=2 Tax=Methanosarcina acetivorans TaxID=2214 RepID=ASD_METAC|nr:phosphatidylserine decarboxylase [Methanosarcina acetivorans]Q8TUF2.1 RecName: Full=Putative archaetidylserine decarboxylase proenzyme; Contains: RecName: Full=Archaetidylserine decarboxylase alpha chain; Contains: RecName: Full=Archaetidylserine decarboxylase beta chain [Methanosarcina acetivorans C2A]AAM03569.1 phosphatidylserine decarboxylase [Methanosarcina acetivorans C2A]HIH95084.1 phosphatidylserine decarboxylase [Methanosarcina acetivorans]
MIAKGSEPWLFAAASATALFAILSWATDSLPFLNHAAHMGMALTFFMVIFFRDPERKVEISDAYMISPADGTVIDIRDRKICIFMFLQNVHVNRAPISGKIREITYKKGGYLPAFCKDSERNERNEFIIHSKYGDVEVTQIAGTIARRIVTYSNVNDSVEQGQRIGMIRFGSRVDVTIPHDFDITVCKGERVLAGKTVIATIKNDRDF